MPPQTITITVEFQTKHEPGTPAQLNQILTEYLKAKGVVYESGLMKV